jgi:hypothetical protein
MTLAELRRLDAVVVYSEFAGERIPTIEEIPVCQQA